MSARFSLFDANGNSELQIVYYKGYRGDTNFEDPLIGTSIDGRGCYEGTSANIVGIKNFVVYCVQGSDIMIDHGSHFGTECQQLG